MRQSLSGYAESGNCYCSGSRRATIRCIHEIHPLCVAGATNLPEWQDGRTRSSIGRITPSAIRACWGNFFWGHSGTFWRHSTLAQLVDDRAARYCKSPIRMRSGQGGLQVLWCRHLACTPALCSRDGRTKTMADLPPVCHAFGFAVTWRRE